jgi:hypothetical protein
MYRLKFGFFTLALKNGPATFSATGLPSGVTLNTSTGVVSGKPRYRGTYKATFKATNPGGSSSSVTSIYVR